MGVPEVSQENRTNRRLGDESITRGDLERGVRGDEWTAARRY